MKNTHSLYLSIILTTLFSGVVFAETDNTGSTKKATTPLTETEIQTSIGRFGEEETIPEGFQFNPAETKLWHDPHLANIKKPTNLHYEFVKSGTYEEGFTDSVYLNIFKLNKDGTRNAQLNFFTAEQKQQVHPDNVTNITGNPVIGIYMQGDVYEMNRLTEGHWRHFQKSIKISLREDAVVEPTTFTFSGKQYQGEKIFFSPYLNDPHRRDFEIFAEKYYEFIFSDELPGNLYQIKTVIPDKGDHSKPLILETLTLINIKESKS